MTPPTEFVNELHRFDPNLRIRWGRHQSVWIIERQMPPRHKQLLAERPSPESKSDRGRDVWEGWRDGYVHVLTVAPELLENRPLVFQTLADADAWRVGGMERLAQKLDELDALQEAANDREIKNWVEAATSEAYDRLKWLQGERVAMTPTPEPPMVDTGLGFKMRDRRRVTA